jgi:hypothetical protein
MLAHQVIAIEPDKMQAYLDRGVVLAKAGKLQLGAWGESAHQWDADFHSAGGLRVKVHTIVHAQWPTYPLDGYFATLARQQAAAFDPDGLRASPTCDRGPVPTKTPHQKDDHQERLKTLSPGPDR